MTDPNDTPLVRIAADVPFAMDDTLGNEAEVTGRDLDALPAARIEVDGDRHLIQ